MAFDEMSMANKRQTIHQNLEQLIGEIPDFIQKVEYLSSNLEDLNGWKEFKFFFKLATNQIVIKCWFYMYTQNLYNVFSRLPEWCYNQAVGSSIAAQRSYDSCKI